MRLDTRKQNLFLLFYYFIIYLFISLMDPRFCPAGRGGLAVRVGSAGLRNSGEPN